MAATPNLASDALLETKQQPALLSQHAFPRPLVAGIPAPKSGASGLVERAMADCRGWVVVGHGSRWPRLLRKFRDARHILEGIYRRENPQAGDLGGVANVYNELLASRVLFQSAVTEVEGALRSDHHVTQVEEPGGKIPRALAAVKCYLSATGGEFEEGSFLKFIQAIQKSQPLEISEIWLLSPMLQFQLLELIAGEIEKSPAATSPDTADRLKTACASLTRTRQVEWAVAFEELSLTEKILKQDPADAYSKMEFQSRSRYLQAIQDLARYSERSEEEITMLALRRAQQAAAEFPQRPRAAVRFTHIGYYLVSSGRGALEKEIGYRPHGAALVRKILLEAPALYYFLGVEFSIFVILLFFISGVRAGVPIITATLFLLLPCSEAAIEAVNQVVRFILPPRTIPRLDFEKGIPESCSTVVAVPALLVSQNQVEYLARALEIRYLNNIDDNVYFALLTDPPDSKTPFDDKDELAALCSSLIGRLNHKYAANGPDRFFHLHRNRTFNATENTWMGWERKRGKLLDFNEFIRGGEDRFPVKAGNAAQLRAIRYVITLDADTQLPRGAAARLVGAMAHPLNQAVVDPVTRTVKAGYGVLQPRIGISVQSVNRSRLAYIYSGQTGLDIYTYAVSDVYQDLFGEGIFTGKGIYEAEVFDQVLRDRFPSNAILSHDLIEGVYARTGLASDIELIDDYPSHFSAYSRRKHRWIRGDWQILRWLFGTVPNAHGERVGNPINVLSRWKILDNLRRSVIEAATFILFLAGWFYLPGSPAVWTATAVALLLIPSYLQGLLALIQQRQAAYKRGAFAQFLSDFATTQVNVLVFLAFLPHQALITLDAIARTVFRLTISHQKLLEWETAAQSEIDNRRDTVVDRYLRLIPFIAIGIAICLAIFRPQALPAAWPILLLWFLSKPAAKWLDRPLRATPSLLTPDDETYLRQAALKTWRFFREFSNAEENWLIPDNIQGRENLAAHRVSTTNIGLLFNSQLAGCLLGMHSIPRFATHAGNTMASVKRMPRFHSHLANWYDTQTLQPTNPIFISSVDNGNLACSLWTLKQGILAILERPLFEPGLFRSFGDSVELAIEAMKKEGRSDEQLAAIESVRDEAFRSETNPQVWCEAVPKLQAKLASIGATESTVAGSDTSWWLEEAQRLLQDVHDMARSLTPWILPEFAAAQGILPNLLDPDFLARLTVNSLSGVYEQILQAVPLPELRALQMEVPACARELKRLQDGLLGIAADADALVNDMDFGLFYDQNRKAISIGFDVAESKMLKSCYDLLASEARSALFVAIAKNDVPQEAWFQLGRVHTHYAKREVLVSWTGTMFEYLMPVLWLKHFPNTFLENSLQGAVDCQRSYAKRHGVPWGISEGACPSGQEGSGYGYQAFGLPALALSPECSKRIVITPYAGALALNVQPREALENLRDMSARGWMGSFGYYESIECRPAPETSQTPCEIVHSWMAHHQGMILVSVGNVLMNSVFQSLFHREVRVEAAERILNERPLSIYARRSIRRMASTPKEA